MNCINPHLVRAAILVLLLSVAIHAHPGPPGHYHPDEVDEFDQIEVVEESRDFNIGGILILASIAVCIGFAFFQKKGGICKNIASHQ